jgi:hypothetical protein
LADCRGKVLEDRHRGIPVDTGVGDADALLQAAWTLRRNFLVPFVDIGFDHDADDAILAVPDLFGDDLSDLWLVAVVLVRISCRSFSELQFTRSTLF